MNKKVMALAVGAAFAAPTAALAQASNVQIYGRLYLEYAYAHQGNIKSASGGNLVNVDELQTPTSRLGFKGEEDLGGGLTAWFQCESTADIRGNAPVGFCGRNSALGMKGSFGSLFVGNWDTPMKLNSRPDFFTQGTGVWGVSFLLFSGSGSHNDAAGPTGFRRRQNNSVSYQSPVWNGVQLFGMVTVPGTTAAAFSTNATLGKPRLWGVSAAYTNGPLRIDANYERHSNFNTLGGLNGVATNNFSSTDNGWSIGGAYKFGPAKVGLLYTKQKFDGGAAGISADVSAWNAAVDWMIQGPHDLIVSYTKANDTGGNAAGAGGTATLVGTRVFNGGLGATGGSMWQVDYLYWFSKRTYVSLGYISLHNDPNARYSLGGFTAPAGGSNQDAIATSIQTSF